MSLKDDADLLTKSWYPYQRNLIYLVKRYPVTYLPSPKRQTKLNKAKWDTAWTEIGTHLCQPSKACEQLWTKIKFRYAKIVILINTGKITKETAMSHPETGRFFDGLLSFMNPFISKITDENIPYLIHKSVNDIFGLKTRRTYVPSKKRYTHFVTHAQVQALLKERQSKEECNLDNMDTQYLQIIVDNAVKRKVEELLLKQDDLSNPNNDNINIINGPMTPSKKLRNVHKRMPNFTLIPSKNIQNNDDENTTKAVNLGLETELIIEDDIKREAEDDNIKIEDDDDIKEANSTLDKNINNTTDENYDLENILPSTHIIMPAVFNTMTPKPNTITSLNNDVIAVECKTDDVAMTDNDEPPVTDDYIRNFFNELGVVMSLELSVFKQKTLKSRINELLKHVLLKEDSPSQRS